MKVYEFEFSEITDLNIGNIAACNLFLKKRALNRTQYLTAYLVHPEMISDDCPKSLRRYARIVKHYLLGFIFLDKNKQEVRNLTLIIDLGENFPTLEQIKDISFINQSSRQSCYYSLSIEEKSLKVTLTLDESSLLGFNQ